MRVENRSSVYRPLAVSRQTRHTVAIRLTCTPLGQPLGPLTAVVSHHLPVTLPASRVDSAAPGAALDAIGVILKPSIWL